MPLTKRQFELGVDEEVENYMREIYTLLDHHKELAYSYPELLQNDAGRPPDETKFERALEVLIEIGAVDKRDVTDTDYYAFARTVNTNSWKFKGREKIVRSGRW